MIDGRTTGTLVGAFPVEIGGFEPTERRIGSSTGRVAVDGAMIPSIDGRSPIVPTTGAVRRPPAFDMLPALNTSVMHV